MKKLSTLFINQIVFTGIHGTTGRELTDKQQFRIDVKIQIDINAAVKSDVLIDTYDYKHIREIARIVIEEEHYVLIETIAYQIAERICQDPKIFSAQVKLTKLQASRNGAPGVELICYRAPQEMI